MLWRRAVPACVLALAAAALGAQAVKVGPEFSVNTYTTNYQTAPAAAIAADNSFVIIWQSYQQTGGSNNDIFGQRFDGFGVKQGSEFMVNTYTTNSQSRPAVAMDSVGNFVVVWSSYNQTGGAQGDIVGQRFDASGVKQGSEFMVNSYTTNGQDYPSVSMDGSGNFVVVWSSVNQAGASSGRDVYARRYDASGVAQGAEFLVNTYTTSDQRAPSVSINDAGHFIVAWTDYSGAARKIMGQRYDSSGAAAGPQFEADTPAATANPLTPWVAIDANDNVTMVWMSYLSSPFGTGIFGQRFDPAGNKVGTQFQANTYTGGFAFHPEVGLLAGGKSVVSWQNNPSGNSDVFARMYDRSAASLGTEFMVNTYTTNDQRSAAIASRSRDRFVISWTSYGQVAGAASEIYGQRLHAAYHFYSLTPCRIVDTRNASGPYGGPALAALSDRRFVLAGQCGIPAGADGVSVNVTVTQPTAAGDVRIFPGTSAPVVSTINYSSGQTRANNATALLGIDGGITVHSDQPTGTAHFILDVNGYFQ
jgi:hypothetical protein